MKKKRKLQKSIFEIIADPYGGEDAECFDHIFTEWLNDADNTIKIGGTMYYKALQIIRTAIHRKEELLIGLSNEMCLKIGDTIIDELGNKYLKRIFRIGIQKYHLFLFPAIIKMSENTLRKCKGWFL